MLSAPALVAAWRGLRRARVDAVVSLGSYAALAPGLVAAATGHPLMLLESNAIMGLAHRALWPWARRRFVGAFWAGKVGVRTVRVGMPMKAAVREVADVARSTPRGSELLVLGGSLGDDFLNKVAPQAAAGLAARAGVAPWRVCHVVGRAADAAQVRGAYAQHGLVAEVVPYLDPIAPALARATIALTSAGAISLHELALARVPAVVVPLAGAAGRHQLANAHAWRGLTGGTVITHEAWSTEAAAAALARAHGAVRERLAVGDFAMASADPAACVAAILAVAEKSGRATALNRGRAG
jgi:UDP-N-acetylglucosamine--N-acetylmuramyl-(pentapeptide) pyrophosphoryl-undecaprenol N-acetylglucosamine transferase